MRLSIVPDRHIAVVVCDWRIVGVLLLKCAMKLFRCVTNDLHVHIVYNQFLTLDKS